MPVQESKRTIESSATSKVFLRLFFFLITIAQKILVKLTISAAIQNVSPPFGLPSIIISFL